MALKHLVKLFISLGEKAGQFEGKETRIADAKWLLEGKFSFQGMVYPILSQMGKFRCKT